VARFNRKVLRSRKRPKSGLQVPWRCRDIGIAFRLTLIFVRSEDPRRDAMDLLVGQRHSTA
jgi:hypothetical protein